jgi:hypothetical protein
MAIKDMANINNNNNNDNNIVINIIMAKTLLWAKMLLPTYLPLLPTYQVNTFFKHFPPKFQNCRAGQKDK